MNNVSVVVVGLGYVGLPLALEFGRIMPTIGVDTSEYKISAYSNGHDPAGEMSDEMFQKATHLTCTMDAGRISEADFVVVAVPTPVDNVHRPNLGLLKRAAETVGRYMKRGAIVVFESTVFPGVTEDICIPIMEKVSGMVCGEDFKVGYSPERINPGDKEHTLTTIIKIVAGQDAETLDKIAELYSEIIDAGVHRAPSIKVAEAAKAVENTQRDLNIALMNEFAVAFKKMGVDTLDVLEAAGTKWNFLPFRPGLVGGHCIGVDPYYLVHKAKTLGYRPNVIMAGRSINNGMGKYVAEQTVKQMIAANRLINGSKVIVMGLSFKEDCRDLRNSRVVDIISELHAYGVVVQVYDPIIGIEEAKSEYDVDLITYEQITLADAVVVAVPHKEIQAISLTELSKKVGGDIPFMDVKSVFDRNALAQAGFRAWRL